MFSLDHEHNRANSPALDLDDDDWLSESDYVARRPSQGAVPAAESSKPGLLESANHAVMRDHSGSQFRGAMASMDADLFDSSLGTPSGADVRAAQVDATPKPATESKPAAESTMPADFDSGASARLMRIHGAQQDRGGTSVPETMSFADFDSLDGASPDPELASMVTSQKAPDAANKPGYVDGLSKKEVSNAKTALGVGSAGTDTAMSLLGETSVPAFGLAKSAINAGQALNTMYEQSKDGDGITNVDEARANAQRRANVLKNTDIKRDGGLAKFRASGRMVTGGLKVAGALRDNKLGNTVTKEATPEQIQMAANPDIQERTLSDFVGTAAQAGRAAGEATELAGLVNIPGAANLDKYEESGQSGMQLFGSLSEAAGSAATASGVGALPKLATAAGAVVVGNGLQAVTKNRAEKQDNVDDARTFASQIESGTRADQIARYGLAPSIDPKLDERVMDENGAYRRTGAAQAKLAADPKALAGRQPLRPTEDPDKRGYAERMGDSAEKVKDGAWSFGSWLSGKANSALDWFKEKSSAAAQGISSLFSWDGFGGW